MDVLINKYLFGIKEISWYERLAWYMYRGIIYTRDVAWLVLTANIAITSILILLVYVVYLHRKIRKMHGRPIRMEMENMGRQI